MTAPPDWAIAAAEREAVRSPCAKSKRGAALYAPERPAAVIYNVGRNGPPAGAPCPGRAVCGDNCGKRCVHAEMRAIRGIDGYGLYGLQLDLVHVKLGADGRVTPGGPPSCWQCSREILDVGFVGGVWLYEAVGVDLSELRTTASATPITVQSGAVWRRYSATDFHAITLRNAGIP